LEARPHDDGESLQEFVTTIKQLTYCDLNSLLVNHSLKEAGITFISEIKGQGIKQQILLEGKGTLNESLRQTFGLQVIKLNLQKMGERHCGGAGPLPNNRKDCKKLM
jgi:hypothetical protein